jgi:hypothetical protein
MAKDFDAGGFIRAQVSKYHDTAIIETQLVQSFPTDLANLKAVAQESSTIGSIVAAVRSAAYDQLRTKLAPHVEAFNKKKAAYEAKLEALKLEFANESVKLQTETGLSPSELRISSPRQSSGTGTRSKLDDATRAKIVAVSKANPTWGNQKVAKEVFGETDFWSKRGTVYSVMKAEGLTTAKE